ncbi:hypothetical protein JCM33374_g1884 [Metschnikowia sp. JCM 33374]|nr:hypothetical protein JCM33374_g1884 [Metschnikowia sp. JCM 33374]
MEARKCPKSISELPQPEEVERFRKPIYYTLPVVVVAFHALTKGGILLVTDFTSHHHSGFALGNVPQSIPCDYVVGSKRLNRPEIFHVGVFLNRVNHIWEELKKFGPPLEKQDYGNYGPEYSCDLSQHCVMAQLNFKIKAYRGGTEGYLSHFSVRDPSQTLAVLSDEYPSSPSVEGLMNRLASRMTPALHTHLSQYMPLESYIPRNAITGSGQPEDVPTGAATDSTRKESCDPPVPNTSYTDVQRSSPLQTQTQTSTNGQKRRLIHPSDAVFQQQFTQPASGGVSRSFDTTAVSEMGDIPIEPRPPIGRPPEVRGGIQNTPIPSSGTFFDLELLCDIDRDISPGRTRFETIALIAAVSPTPEYLFVRPFRRSMKIAPFRITLEKGNTSVTAEVISEEQLCHFFGIEEVEVAIEHLEEFISALKSLIGKTARINIEKKVLNLSSGHDCLYWRVSSSLKTLLQNTLD